MNKHNGTWRHGLVGASVGAVIATLLFATVGYVEMHTASRRGGLILNWALEGEAASEPHTPYALLLALSALVLAACYAAFAKWSTFTVVLSAMVVLAVWTIIGAIQGGPDLRTPLQRPLLEQLLDHGASSAGSFVLIGSCGAAVLMKLRRERSGPSRGSASASSQQSAEVR
jgi:hypothetical protein